MSKHDRHHAARRRNPARGLGVNRDFGYLYTSIRDHLRKKARSLWLATATPMQIDPVEVCDLLALTDRVGAFQFDPTLTLQCYEVLTGILHDEEVTGEEWDFLRNAARAVQTEDPLLWQFLEDSVIDGRIRTTLRQWLEYGRIPRGRDRKLVCRFIFSTSPLSRVMLRHTRRLLEIYRDNGQLKQNLARRHILSMPRIVFSPLEKRVYDQLEEYCNGLVKQLQENQDSQNRNVMGFLLSFLRLRFASSLYAIRETLGRRLHKVEATLRHQLTVEPEESDSGAGSLEDLVFEDEEEDDLAAVESLLKNRTRADLEWERDRLEAMIESMADLTGPSSKMQVLLEVLDRRRNRQTGRIKQTVIFTRFYDTLTDIVTRLRQVSPHMAIGTYSGRGGSYFHPDSGRMMAVDRQQVKERFLRGELDVLVCTDAAAEGLNLQTADLLVNFDLGWNPMKIEQRIGRIDRIGQKHTDVYILNLCYAGNAEEVVYGRLLSRLTRANMIVGTQQISLLPVGPDDFQELAEGRLRPEELEARARKRIELQRRTTESMEIKPEDLYEIYIRMAQPDGGSPAPVNLSAIWETLSRSAYLQNLGCRALSDKSKRSLALFGIEGVPDGGVVTASRQVYEEGLAELGTRVHFASYGDPFFEAILTQVSQYELAGCVRRIAVPVPGMDGVEMVGYAVACCSGGVRQVRLIARWSDLEDLELAEGEPLHEQDIEPLREKLEAMVREEFRPYMVADQIKRENRRAAFAQQMLAFFVIRSLLESRAPFVGDGDEVLFWPVLRDVGSLFENRDRILVNDLPADALRPVAQNLLFDCKIPTVGGKAHLRAPRILGQAAMDAASCLADSMKVRKSELHISTVLRRLQREAESRLRRIDGL